MKTLLEPTQEQPAGGVMRFRDRERAFTTTEIAVAPRAGGGAIGRSRRS